MKGATSRKRLRPTQNTDFSVKEHILHSTAIDESDPKRTAFPSHFRDIISPIVITAPSGFPQFTLVLQQHGFLVSKPRNHIRVDQLVFRKDLSDWIESKSKQMPIADNEASKFIFSMKGYLNVRENFDQSMTPTLHPDEVFQDSLLHNLLSISVLQRHLTNIILPAISEVSCVASSQEQVDRLAAMLGQLKWLPSRAGLTSYSSIMLGTVETATNLAKKTLIRFYPDIIPESHHSQVATTLKNMLETADSPIVSAIMDCFSSLDISLAEWDGVRDAATTQMLNAPLQDFPAYFAFLFRTEDATNLSGIILGMREKLELIPLGGDDAKNAIHMVEIVEKIRFCASVNPNMVPIWTKQVKDDLTSDSSSVKPLDLIMLLIFGETFKAALVPLRLICLEHKLVTKLLDNLLQHNMPIVNQVFQTLTKLCDSFLRNPKDAKAYSSVQHILVKLFVALSPLETQEITSNLICILMNGYPNSRDVVLKILTEITEREPKKLLMFAPHFMGVLEGAIKFPAHQIRQLMNILATLAHVKDCTDSERFGCEFTILLRKYLTHSNTQTRCFGVMGALATVHQLSTNSETFNEDRILELLRLAWSFVKREQDPCCIFFDELSNIVDALPDKTCQEFHELIAQSFVSSWTNMESTGVPLHKLQSKQTTLKLTVQMEAGVTGDETNENTVLVFEEKPLGLSPHVIPSQTRLVCKLTEKTKGEIDLILAAPLLFPDVNLYYSHVGSIPACTFSQRFQLGIYLIVGINYFRECISAFVGKEDASLRIQVWYRLTNVVFLQQILSQNFHEFPSLPMAYVTGKPTVSGGGGASTSSDITRKKPKPKGKKKKKKNEDEEDPLPEESLGFEVCVQPPQLIPHLRRLDPTTFALLQAPLSIGSAINFSTIWQKLKDGADITTVAKSVEILSPESLSLLLLEINQQTKDPANSFNVLEVKDLVKWITQQIHIIRPVLENRSAKKCYRSLDECFQLILTTLSSYCEQVSGLSDCEEQEKLSERVVSGLTAELEIEENLDENSKIHAAVKFIQSLSSCIRQPVKAVEHLKSLASFHALFPDDDVVKTTLVRTAEKYLKKEWKLASAQVELMLKTWILKSESPLEAMQTIISAMVEEDHGNLGSCSNVNFHTWYSVVLSLLSQHVSKYGKKASAGEAGQVFWIEAVRLFKELVFISESHKESLVLVSLLRHSRLFVESFTNAGSSLVPVIHSKSLSTFKPFIKDLQLTTRKLQMVCEHSKVHKDPKLVRNVPPMRRALETLVFRVREILAVNEVSQAFWLGSLRHKTLDGEEINSQPYNEPGARYEEMDNESDSSSEVVEESDSDSLL